MRPLLAGGTQGTCAWRIKRTAAAPCLSSLHRRPLLTSNKLLQARSASAYERPFLFVEIGDKEGDWSIIFSNTRAGEVAGAVLSGLGNCPQ